jgi:hypothetical protein
MTKFLAQDDNVKTHGSQRRDVADGEAGSRSTRSLRSLAQGRLSAGFRRLGMTSLKVLLRARSPFDSPSQMLRVRSGQALAPRLRRPRLKSGVYLKARGFGMTPSL